MPAVAEYGTRTLTPGAEVNWSIGDPSRQIIQLFFYTNGWATENQYRGFVMASYPITYSIGLRSFRQPVGGIWNQAQWFWPADTIFGNRIYFKASKAVPSGATIWLAAYS